MLELIMLVMGFVVLIRGRMSLSKTKEVRGAIARIVGLIMLAPVPIVVGYAVATNKQADEGLFGELFVVEIVVVLVCFVLAMTVAYANAEWKDEGGDKRKFDDRRDEDDWDRDRNDRDRWRRDHDDR